jgi:hypothetical protein
VSDADEPTTEYPPTSWDTGIEFEAPGPVSRPLANYLAMCAPRTRLDSRATRFGEHAGFALAAVGAVN